MKRIKQWGGYRYGLALISLLGVVGCNEEPGGLLTREISPAPESERGTTLEQRVQEQTIDPQPVTMARTHSIKIAFADRSSELTDGAQKELKELIENLDKNKPSYLTIRAEDRDTIDATEPEADFARFTPERVEVIKQQFERNNVELADVAVDKAGAVEDYGEANVMARPEDNITADKYQYIVVTFEEIQDKRQEKIETEL